MKRIPRRCGQCRKALTSDRTWYCKTCMPAVTEEALQAMDERLTNWQRPDPKPVNREGVKLCNTPECGYHPRTEFTRQCNTKDGLRGTCRKCSSAYMIKLRREISQRHYAGLRG